MNFALHLLLRSTADVCASELTEILPQGWEKEDWSGDIPTNSSLPRTSHRLDSHHLFPWLMHRRTS